MEFSWLAPYNIAVSAIYIFLIGLPAAVSQLTVPDVYRNIFRDRFGQKYFGPLIIGGISVLIYYLTLGNIYLLGYAAKNSIILPTVWKLLATIFLIALASGAVLSFLNFLGYFEKYGFNKKPRVVFEILDHIKSQYQSEKENCINDLRYLSKVINRHEYGEKFIEVVFFILPIELKEDSKERLDNVRDLIELLENLLLNDNACTKYNISEIINLLNSDLILESIETGIINRNNLANLFVEIGKNTVRNNYVMIHRLFLKKIVNDFEQLIKRKMFWLKLYKYASQNKSYEFVNPFFLLIKKEKLFDRRIAILSYINEINSTYKKKVKALVTKQLNLSRDNFNKEIDYLKNQGDFDSVDKVNKLWVEVYGLPESFLNLSYHIEEHEFNIELKAIYNVLNHVNIHYQNDKKSCIDILRYLSRVIDRQQDCDKYIEVLFNIMNAELKDKAVDKLDKIKDLIELLEELLQNESACTKHCLVKIINSLNSDLIKNSIDVGINRDNLENIYLEIATNAIRNNHIYEYKYLLNQIGNDLEILTKGKKFWLSLYRYAAQHKSYDFVNYFFSLIKKEKLEYRRIAILALLNEINGTYKKNVNALVRQLKLTRKDFNNEIFFLKNQLDFDAVDKVNKLWVEIFGLPELKVV